jgi:hypothetical protein
VNIRLPLAAKLSQVLKVPVATLAAVALAEEEGKTARHRKRK